jgi:hypothetical protein
MSFSPMYEKNHSGDHLFSERLDNGDLFKRRYAFYSKAEALKAFKAEFKAANSKGTTL